MPNYPKILAFAGSAREGSLNQKLLSFSIGKVRQHGADVTVVDLRALELPIFDEDLEAHRVPQGAIELRELLRSHQGVLIATPEYNGSVPPLLKNAIDWSSRQVDGALGSEPWTGKIGAVMSASQGPFGGVRGISHLRDILTKLGVMLTPNEVTLPYAQRAFAGELPHDEFTRQLISTQAHQLVSVLNKLLQGSPAERR